jgi:hypothetical protein
MFWACFISRCNVARAGDQGNISQASTGRGTADEVCALCCMRCSMTMSASCSCSSVFKLERANGQ